MYLDIQLLRKNRADSAAQVAEKAIDGDHCSSVPLPHGASLMD
jgi:hypothetical protein